MRENRDNDDDDHINPNQTLRRTNIDPPNHTRAR